MTSFGIPLITLVTWLPLVGVLGIIAVPSRNRAVHLGIALAASIASFLVALYLLFTFNWTDPGYQMVEYINWIPSWGIGYALGIDGISVGLMVLATFIPPIALISTWDSVHKFFRTFTMLMLLLQSGMTGVFMAQDMFLFFIFFEFTIIPMALLIGIWGSEHRVNAATRFFVYTFSGSVFMLVAMIAVYLAHGEQTGVYTSNIDTITKAIHSGALVFDTTTELLLFGGFFIAFMVKTPLWPLHTWLPLAHSEAPTAGSVDLAAVLLKLGPYGMMRFNLAFFPDASRWAAPVICVLAVISILYGAVVSFAQTDIKRLVAYSSVSHMGFVVLGVFSLNQIGMSGALLQMINHGITSSGLFLIVGMLYERRHTREMAAFGGLWKVMPVYGALTLLIVLASIGLPGTNSFIGEYTIMQGAWIAPQLTWYFVLPTVIGVILGAAYMLKMFRHTFMGEITISENAALTDITRHEVLQLGLIIVPIILIGLFPIFLLGPMQGTITLLAQQLANGLAGLP